MLNFSLIGYVELGFLKTYPYPCPRHLTDRKNLNAVVALASAGNQIKLNWAGKLGLGPEISESLDGVSVSTSFAQSRLVSVSTSIDFPSLDEYRSRHPRNFSVSMSLGLDIQ